MDGRVILRKLAVLLVLVAFATTVSAQEWARLRDDGVRDARSPAVKMLQEPAEGLGELAKFAPDKGVGNQVRWVRLIESGAIKPLSNLQRGTEVRTLDLDIFLDIGGSLPAVRFPHRAHTMWLDCKNCHDHIFQSKVGTTDVRMLKILEGEQCGLCHGAVAFPLTECGRCHSVPQADVEKMEAEKKLVRGPNGKAGK